MSTYPNSPQSPQSPPPAYGPAPEGGTKILLLIISFILPIVGIIIGVIYLQRPDPDSQKFGRQALIAAVCFFGLFCVCFACYFVAIFALGFTPLLILPFVPTSTPIGGGLIKLLLYA